ncbi:long-chain fatty acid--CoA ligase [Dactylosporangium vinaceum]|uniref:Class I adenylate-forming enzyme family protein n=1 Tax=Dactylosporangium vinaceum TaxID=53362 RepID=A0ABV5MEE3_9ACTN|nr:fatty acid--CoA ligase family protein [Dactylosporangium vinaceum]UAB92425.1 long-chain fatty acid--CoA ligase [Dactylosporangium vinaceum]
MSESWWGEELLAGGPDDAVWARGRRPATHGELREQVAWLARVLRAQGLGPGRTVVLKGPRSLTLLWTLLALWSLGAQVVLVEQWVPLTGDRSPLRPCRPEFQVTIGVPAPPGAFVDEAEVRVVRDPAGEPARSGDCLLQLSSGTTGRPRLVGRTPESLIAELDRLQALAGMPRAGERVLLLESFVHSYGLVCGILHALAAGAELVLPAGPARALDVDAVIGAPGDFAALVERPRPAPRLRLALCGGEMLPPETYHAFAERYGVHIGQAYGTSETGLVATDLAGQHGPPFLGRPVPGVRTRIVGGALEVYAPRSPYPFDPQVGFGGWLPTHDLVAADPDTGVLRLRGRAATGAARRPDVDLFAVERALRAHRAVVDAVVLDGEDIEAYVAASPHINPHELAEWCRQVLGPATLPDRYHLTPELPRTAGGKLLRNRAGLREYITTE